MSVINIKQKSDGCTGVDWLVRWFMPWIRCCCVTHDWLLVVMVKLPRQHADAIMRECIESKSKGWWSGWWFWLVAIVFYGFVRLRARLGSVSTTYMVLWLTMLATFTAYQILYGRVL